MEWKLAVKRGDFNKPSFMKTEKQREVDADWNLHKERKEEDETA